jgi:hypothetical protein
MVEATILADCTCAHSVDCNHECHGRHCDPTEHICSIEFLPDEGGLTPWGCADCTPGLGLPHGLGCVAVARPASAFDQPRGAVELIPD